MFECFWTGQRAVLGDVADEDHRGGRLLGECLQPRGGGTHLTD
jgi:hypothetical protein